MRTKKGNRTVWKEGEERDIPEDLIGNVLEEDLIELVEGLSRLHQVKHQN